MTARDYREAWAWTHLMLNGTASTRAQLLGYMADLRTAATAPEPLSRCVVGGELGDPTHLAAHVEHLRDAPVTMVSAGGKAVIRSQDATLDETVTPASGRDRGGLTSPSRQIAADPSRRRGVFGRFFGMFGL
jgi:hypothetical protein